MVKFNFNVPKCKRQTKISFDKTGIDYSSNKTDHFHTICDENGNALSPTDLLNYASNSINNISSNNNKNNLSQSNDLSTMDNIEEWIDYLNTTAKELKSERDALTGEFNKFLSGAKENKFDGLWNDGYVYYPPNELKENQTARDQFLANNGYTLNMGDSNYFVGVEAFNQYVDNEYTELFDKYLKKEMNMTYDEYLAKIYQYNADLSRLENGVYNLRQQYKEQPYLELAESDDYKKWLSEYTLPQFLFNDNQFLDKYVDFFNGGFDDVDKYSESYSQLIDLCGDPNNILTPDEYCDLYVNQHMTEVAIIEDTNGKSEKINELRKQAHAIYDDVYYNALASYIGVSLDDINIIEKCLKFSYEWKYLTDDEKKMFLYLNDEDKIRDYLSAIKDKINQRAGREEADEFLAKITDENGNINYNLATDLLVSGKGILMGISNFGEGLSNVFNSEGVISDNQYAQMYIMEGITNTSGIYINELIQNISEREGVEQAEEFAKKIYDQRTGQMDLEYAKTVLNSDEYKALAYKVGKDENTLLDFHFELCTSLGNMLPSMAATFILSSLGAPSAAVSIIGNTMMGLSSGGNARNQALVSGNSDLSSTVYGILSGVSETCFGMLLGNIPGLNTSASLSLKGIFKEGMEEYLQEYIDAGLKSMILGEDINFDELSEDALKSFIYGCILSFGTNLVSVGAKFIINGKSVELNSIEDYKSFFQILNDSDISISSREDGTNGMTAKKIVIDENISNKAEMIDIMKSIFKDAEVYTKIENENYIYDGHISQIAENVSTINEVGNVDTQITDVQNNTNMQENSADNSFFYVPGFDTLKDVDFEKNKVNYDYSLDPKNIVDSFMFMDNVSEEQLQQFNTQVNNYLEARKISSEFRAPKLDESGKVILEKDSLLHGTRFEIDKLESISKLGILSGQAFGIPEDGETYCCADFYKLNSDLQIESIDGYFSKKNSSKTPFGNYGKNDVAFIVNPIETSQKLFDYDCYKSGTVESEIAKSFVNQNGLLNNEGDIGLSSILYGVPSNCISGIIVGDKVASNPEKINTIKSLFPNCYISDRNGNVIYSRNTNRNGNIIHSKITNKIGFQFFGGHKAKELTEATYNSLVSGMELQDAKYGNGAAIKALYNYLYDNGDINQLSRDGGLRSTVESLSFHELNSFYNKISEVYLKSSSYSNGLNSNTSYVRNYSTEHGFQVGADDFGDGWLSVQIKNGFIKQEQLNNMISNLNNKGYIGTDAGKYIDNVFDGNSDVYLKTVHSSDVNSIFEQGIRCLGTSTSGFGTAPLDISEISLENVVTKVEGIYDLVALLKNSNGISQGGNPIDGAVIIKVPKGAQVSDMVYFNNDTNTYCINSGFIDSFLQCDSYGTIDSPLFNKQSFGKNTQNNVNIDSVNNYNSQNINSIRTLEQEILANLPNTDDVTKIRYLYLELNKRLNYDINYFAGDNNTKSEIYNNYLTFESLSNNSVICKGWSELYKQLLIDAGIPENCIRICGSDVSGSHRWVEISMGDHFIRCDATQRFNGSIDLANAKSGASTVGFVYLSNEWAGKSFAYNMPGTEEEISLNDSWLRNIDQQLGYASNGIYFNELSDSLVSEFYKPGLFEKVFGINQDKLLEKKKEILLNYELPDGMKAIEAKNFFDTLKRMFFQNTDVGVEIEFGYRQISSNAYSGVVMILEHDSNGIECRIIDDYSDSFIIHFQNLHEYEEYLNVNGIK